MTGDLRSVTAAVIRLKEPSVLIGQTVEHSLCLCFGKGRSFRRFRYGIEINCFGMLSPVCTDFTVCRSIQPGADIFAQIKFIELAVQRQKDLLCTVLCRILVTIQMRTAIEKDLCVVTA